MLGIIVINYNTYNKTIDCVESIRSTYKGEYKLYIIDNNSTNDSAFLIEEKYKGDSDVIVILSKVNLGYARGNNLGLKYAVEDGCNYVLFSNNDIIFRNGAIDNMLLELMNTSACIVGPKVYKPDGTRQCTLKKERPSFFKYINNETYIRNINIWYKRGLFLPEKSCDVYWLAGCCFAVKVEDFLAMDGFDPKTFLYFEEYIISEKMLKANKTERYCNGAEVLHFHGASMGGNINIPVRSENWKSEMYFVSNYWGYGKVKVFLLRTIRRAEVKYNLRKEKQKRELYKQYILLTKQVIE